jgi:hypothetical protein
MLMWVSPKTVGKAYLSPRNPSPSLSHFSPVLLSPAWRISPILPRFFPLRVPRWGLGTTTVGGARPVRAASALWWRGGTRQRGDTAALGGRALSPGPPTMAPTKDVGHMCTPRRAAPPPPWARSGGGRRARPSPGDGGVSAGLGGSPFLAWRGGTGSLSPSLEWLGSASLSFPSQAQLAGPITMARRPLDSLHAAPFLWCSADPISSRAEQ